MLGADMGEEFLEVVEHLKTETSNVNAVVLTGAGKAFSAGGDLSFLMQRHNDTPSRNTCVRLTTNEELDDDDDDDDGECTTSTNDTLTIHLSFLFCFAFSMLNHSSGGTVTSCGGSTNDFFR